MCWMTYKDRTWCADADSCPCHNRDRCDRALQPKDIENINRMDSMVSFSHFKNTDYCSLSKMNKEDKVNEQA